MNCALNCFNSKLPYLSTTEAATSYRYYRVFQQKYSYKNILYCTKLVKLFYNISNVYTVF